MPTREPRSPPSETVSPSSAVSVKSGAASPGASGIGPPSEAFGEGRRVVYARDRGAYHDRRGADRAEPDCGSLRDPRLARADRGEALAAAVARALAHRG